MQITPLQKHLIRTMARKYNWITAGRDPADELATMQNPHGHDLSSELQFMDQWMHSLTRHGRGDKGWTRKDWYHRMQAWLNRKKRTQQGDTVTNHKKQAQDNCIDTGDVRFVTKAVAHQKRLIWDNPKPINDSYCAKILDNIYRGFEVFGIVRGNVERTNKAYLHAISMRLLESAKKGTCAADYLQELLHLRIQHYHPASPRLMAYLASHKEHWLLHLFLEAFYEQTIMSQRLPIKPQLTAPDYEEPCTCPGHSGDYAWCNGPGWWIRRTKASDGFVAPAPERTAKEELMINIDLSNPKSLTDIKAAISCVIDS